MYKSDTQRRSAIPATVPLSRSSDVNKADNLTHLQLLS